MEVSSSNRMDSCLPIAQCLSLATQHHVPAVSDRTVPTEQGGLLSYGPVDDDLFVGAALTSIASSTARTRQSFRFRCQLDLS